MLSTPVIVRSPSPKAYQAMVDKFAREGLDYETVWSQVSEKGQTFQWITLLLWIQLMFQNHQKIWTICFDFGSRDWKGLLIKLSNLDSDVNWRAVRGSYIAMIAKTLASSKEVSNLWLTIIVIDIEVCLVMYFDEVDANKLNLSHQLYQNT